MTLPNLSTKYLVLISASLGMIACLFVLVWWFLPANSPDRSIGSDVLEPTSKPTGFVTDLRDGWSQYTDTFSNFAFDFKSTHGTGPNIDIPLTEPFLGTYSINWVTQPADNLMFGVSVIPHGYSDIEDWLRRANQAAGDFMEYVVLRRTKIAGQEAIVVYSRWRTGPDDIEPPDTTIPYEHRVLHTVFVRHGVAYSINTSYLSLHDTERIWNSFRFLDDPGAPALVDGQLYNSGVFHDAATVDGKKTYISSRFGISVSYPSDHLLFEHPGVGEPSQDTEYFAGSIVIAPEIPMREAIARAAAGHFGGGAPSMSFSFHRRVDPNMSIETGMRTYTAHSNFHPDMDLSTRETLRATTVAGVPAFTYRSELGMYEMEHAAFAYGDWLVFASVPDLGSGTGTGEDFKTVLSSLRLQ